MWVTGMRNLLNKNYLKSNVGLDGLNILAMLSTECEEETSLDFEILLRKSWKSQKNSL